MTSCYTGVADQNEIKALCDQARKLQEDSYQLGVRIESLNLAQLRYGAMEQELLKSVLRDAPDESDDFETAWAKARSQESVEEQFEEALARYNFELRDSLKSGTVISPARSY